MIPHDYTQKKQRHRDALYTFCYFPTVGNPVVSANTKLYKSYQDCGGTDTSWTSSSNKLNYIFILLHYILFIQFEILCRFNLIASNRLSGDVDGLQKYLD